MTDRNDRIDWSDKCWRELLVASREMAWNEDTLDKIAAWLQLKPGMTMVDVGCGLAYLGHIYWRYFGQGGAYYGVDRSLKLLKDARGGARRWGQGGPVSFLAGDAYHLPLRTGCVDVAICQTLLIHLADPKKALEEMIRVAKPGGLIVCKEPDNLSPRLGGLHSSLPELSIEDRLLAMKVYMICRNGRIKRGLGDVSIGRQVPHMMRELGLRDIDIRLNDKVFYLEPPYEDDAQRHAIENIKMYYFDEERREKLIEREREEFIAGGGELAEFSRYQDSLQKWLPEYRRQIENGEFWGCGANHSYVIRGRKPH